MLRESASACSTREPGLQVRVEVHEREVGAAELEHPKVALVHDGRRRGVGRGPRQRPHAQVAVGDLALGVVALQRERAAAEPVQLRRAREAGAPAGSVQSTTSVSLTRTWTLGLRTVTFSVNHSSSGRDRPVDVANAVEAARLLELEVVAVLLLRVVDLDLEALGGPVLLLEGRVEVESRSWRRPWP